MEKSTAPPGTAPEGKRSPKRLLVSAAVTVIVGLSLSFVGHQIIKGWPQFAAQPFRLSIPAAAAAFVLLLLNFGLVSWAWAVIFRDLGEKVSVAQTFAIIYFAQIGRYVPGKIWIIFGQLFMADKLGFRKSTSLTAGVVQNILGPSSSFLILALCALGTSHGPLMFWIPLALAAGGYAAFLLAPSFVERLINRLLVRLGKEPAQLAVKPVTVLKIFLIMGFAWIEQCLAFVLLTASVTAFDPRMVFELTVVYILACNIGFFMLIVPGGIGIREGTITAMLGPLIGPATAGIVALLGRFWFILGELLSFGAAVAIAKRLKAKGIG